MKNNIETTNKVSPTKKIILEAAAELFREKGYAGSSVRELAQKVGLEASSLYNHIKSKEQILVEICMGNARQFTDGIDLIDQTQDTTVNKLKAIIELHINIATAGISSVSVFNDEWKHLSEPYHSEFLRLRKYYEQKVVAIITQGIENSELRTVDPLIATYSFLTSLRWIHYKLKQGKSAKERLYDNLCTILLNGLATS